MDYNPSKNRYLSINDWLKDKFGERIYKISLESGFLCPNRNSDPKGHGCIFCNLASYTPATAPNGWAKLPTIAKQLEEGIEYVKKRHHVSKAIAYFQSGTNTNAPIEHLKEIFTEAIDSPFIVGLAVATRPDCINQDHAKLFAALAAKKLVWVELGLQSSHDSTLDAINRGHNVTQFSKAAELLQANGILVCAHVILGLPGETKGMMLETAEFLNKTGVWGVKIHNLHVLRETELAELYEKGEIEIHSLEKYADLVVDFLEVLDPKIVIHRLNSHSPRSLTVAPKWSINKLAIFNEVEKRLKERDTYQGKKF